MGIPPLCQTAHELHDLGVETDVYVGYRDTMFALEDFEPYAHATFVATEKGDEGYHGFVTDLLKPEAYDAVFTCGPRSAPR